MAKVRSTLTKQTCNIEEDENENRNITYKSFSAQATSEFAATKATSAEKTGWVTKPTKKSQTDKPSKSKLEGVLSDSERQKAAMMTLFPSIASTARKAFANEMKVHNAQKSVNEISLPFCTCLNREHSSFSDELFESVRFFADKLLFDIFHLLITLICFALSLESLFGFS